MSKEEKFSKRSTDEELSQRFYVLNVIVALILLAVVFVSISQFGAQAWHNKWQIGLVLSGEKNQLGWNSSQYLSLKSICDEFDYDLIIRENVPSDYNSCKKAVDELAKRGARIIQFSNGCHLESIAEFEKTYPRIKFSTIESVSALYPSGRYSIFAFEGSYLAGILAGLHTKTNKIGYVAPFSEPEINQGINAFTLGVQRVNPNAEVLLNWTGSWDNPNDEEQAVQNLKAEHVDILTYHQNGDTVPNIAERAAISFISFNESYPSNKYCLAAIKIDWKSAYMDLLTYMNHNKSNKNVGYGINQGMINVEVLKDISSREHVLFDIAYWEIKNGRLIFSGEIFDRSGIKRCSENETISVQSLQTKMNWQVRGVRIVGS